MLVASRILIMMAPSAPIMLAEPELLDEGVQGQHKYTVELRVWDEELDPEGR